MRQIVSRLYVLNGMFVTALVRQDHVQSEGKSEAGKETFMTNLMAMMVGAMSAPFPTDKAG